jgi:hypothetical protein
MWEFRAIRDLMPPERFAQFGWKFAAIWNASPRGREYALGLALWLGQGRKICFFSGSAQCDRFLLF